MGMRATVKQYSIIVRTRKKVKGRTKLEQEQEQIRNVFQGFHSNFHDRCRFESPVREEDNKGESAAVLSAATATTD